MFHLYRTITGQCSSLRYSVDIPFDKQVVNKDCLKDLRSRRRARFEIKKKLEDRLVLDGLCTY